MSNIKNLKKIPAQFEDIEFHIYQMSMALRLAKENMEDAERLAYLVWKIDEHLNEIQKKYYEGMSAAGVNLIPAEGYQEAA